jgi:hypothetical protein
MSAQGGRVEGLPERFQMALDQVNIALASKEWKARYADAPFGILIFDMASPIAMEIATGYIPAPVVTIFAESRFVGTVLPLEKMCDLAHMLYGDHELDTWCKTTHMEGLHPCLILNEEGIVSVKILRDDGELDRIRITSPGGSA